MVGVPDGRRDAFDRVLAYHAGEVAVEAGPYLPLFACLVPEPRVDLGQLLPYRREGFGEPVRREHVHGDVRDPALFQLAERLLTNVDGDPSWTVHAQHQGPR